MDEVEAAALADVALEPLRAESYSALVDRFIGPGDRCEHSEAVGSSGVRYQVEVQAFWDAGRPGDLRVRAAVDDGGRRAYRPLRRDFILAPDGSFVGE
jgi:hypothetical protein